MSESPVSKLTEQQVASVANVAGQFDVQSSDWRNWIDRSIDEYIQGYAKHDPKAEPLTRQQAWDRMCVMLRALGAEV